jgi:hypothetical protein
VTQGPGWVVRQGFAVAGSRGLRKGLIALAFVSLAGCARAPGSATSLAPESASSRALVGAWHSSVQFSSGVLAPIKDLEFLYVFNSGGTMTESSNYDATPPVPPAYGEWRQTVPGRFEAKYTFFTTTPPPDMKLLAAGGGWLPAGSGVLTEQITLAADGRSYDSAITLEMFGVTGKPVTGGGKATTHSTRAGY